VAAVAATLAIGSAPAAWSITSDEGDLSRVDALHGGKAEHCDEAVAEGFLESVECGDELFEERFNAVDGVGGNVGDGGRFSRVPRADLAGPGQWASHVPAPRDRTPSRARPATRGRSSAARATAPDRRP
jgi:hypothetical protein